MVLCTVRRALLVFVAAACASSDTARPRAWGRPKKQPPPQVQQLTQLQLRQHAEWQHKTYCECLWSLAHGGRRDGTIQVQHPNPTLETLTLDQA